MHIIKCTSENSPSLVLVSRFVWWKSIYIRTYLETESPLQTFIVIIILYKQHNFDLFGKGVCSLSNVSIGFKESTDYMYIHVTSTN